MAATGALPGEAASAPAEEGGGWPGNINGCMAPLPDPGLLSLPGSAGPFCPRALISPTYSSKEVKAPLSPTCGSTEVHKGLQLAHRHPALLGNHPQHHAVHAQGDALQHVVPHHLHAAGSAHKKNTVRRSQKKDAGGIRRWWWWCPKPTNSNSSNGGAVVSSWQQGHAPRQALHPPQSPPHCTGSPLAAAG